MSNFECPSCKEEVDAGDIPDYLTDMGIENYFEYECICGHTFKVYVDWSPNFYVSKE